MIVITDVQHEILKAIFTSEVEANEQALNLKKEDEKASEQQRSIESRLNLDVKEFDDGEGKMSEDDWEQSLIDSGPITLLELLRAVQRIIKDKTRELETCQKEDIKNIKKVIKTERKKEEWISDFLTKREKIATKLKKIEKGTTSGMIEKHGVNRKTFTENIDSLVEENLIEESAEPEERGEQTWKYYKTTILGKVLIFKPMKIVSGYKGIEIVDFPPESYSDEPNDDLWGVPHVAFFYNYLERLKKFDLYEAQIQERQKAKDLKYRGDVPHEQLNYAMVGAFDFIDITKLEYRELSTFWGHEVHYPDPEYGVSIMVPILPEAGFTPNPTIAPMGEHEMRYQREKREKKFPEPGPLGEKGWFVNISAYFRLDEWNPKTGKPEEEMVIKTRRKMFDFIEDVLTFNFLVNLKIITGNLKAASPATKKLFKDPDLNKFYNNMLNELVERSGSLDSYLKKYKI